MLRQSIMLNRDVDLNLGETSGYGGVIDLGLGGSYSGGYGKDSCLTIDIASVDCYCLRATKAVTSRKEKL